MMRRYRKGQFWRPPTAADNAAAADSIETHRRRPELPQAVTRPIDGNQVIVRNDSGSAQAIGDVLAVTSSAFLTAVDREFPWVSADSLDANNFWFPLCVLLEPLANGGIGPALVSGVAVTKVNVGATTHTRAYPTSAAVLVSGTFGPFRILSDLTSTGSQLVLCLIGTDWPILRGKLDAALNSGSSAAMSVWDGATLADTSENITLYDSSALPFITAGYKIASGVAVTASFASGKWYLLTPAACEVAQ